jgi:hypothetical protein
MLTTKSIIKLVKKEDFHSWILSTAHPISVSNLRVLHHRNSENFIENILLIGGLTVTAMIKDAVVHPEYRPEFR